MKTANQKFPKIFIIEFTLKCRKDFIIFDRAFKRGEKIISACAELKSKITKGEQIKP